MSYCQPEVSTVKMTPNQQIKIRLYNKTNYKKKLCNERHSALPRVHDKKKVVKHKNTQFFAVKTKCQ